MGGRSGSNVLTICTLAIILLITISSSVADFRTSTAALRAASLRPTTTSLQHAQFEDSAPLKAVLDSLPSVHKNNEPEFVLEEVSSPFTLEAFSGSDDFSLSDFSASFSFSQSFSGDSGVFSESASFSFSFSESGFSFSEFSGSELPPLSFSESGEFSESGSGFSFSDEFSGSFSDFSGSAASMSLSGGTPCFPNPCQNGGTCEFDLDTNTETCDCTYEWDGEFCQTPASPSTIDDFALVLGTPSKSVLLAKWLPVTKGADVTYTLHFGEQGGALAATPIDDSHIVSGKYVVTLSGLTPATTYEGYVVASNGHGQTTSNTAVLATSPIGPTQMDAPTIIHASAYHIDIQWTAPASPPVNEIQKYVVTITSSEGEFNVSVTDTSSTWARVDSLEVGVTYQFQIQAVDVSNIYGDISSLSDAATTAYGAPWGLSNITVVSVGLDQISLSWSEPWDLNDATSDDITYYFYLTSTVAGETTTLSASVTGELSLTITGLKSGREYRINYLASNAYGESDLNDHAVSKKTMVTAPKIVSFKAVADIVNPQASLSNNDSVVITFDKATNKPALTSATLSNYVSFSGSNSAVFNPVWNSAGTVLTIYLSSASGFTLGSVKATVGNGSIALKASDLLGGSAAGTSTSGPLSGNFGFADTLLNLADVSSILEDAASTFTALSAQLLTSSTVLTSVNINIQPYVSGATVTSGGLTGTSTTALPLSGTLSSLQSTFGSIVYTPPADYNGVDIITIDIQLGTTQIYFDAIVVDIAPVNDAPVLSVSSTTTTQGVDSAFTLTGSSVTDVDSTINTAATLTAAVVTSDSLHSCRFTSAVAGVIYNPAFVSGTQSAKQKITAYGSVAAVSSAISSITCTFGLADPTDISEPSISITINDGANGADPDDTSAVPAVAGTDIAVTLTCTSATLTAPTLQFSDDATAILITFPETVIIDTPSDQSCSGWFNAASLAKLGTGAECYGVGLDYGRSTLQAVIGSGSTVAVGDVLTLGTFTRCPGSVALTGATATVVSPHSPVKPTIAVDAPAQVAKCGAFDVAAFASGVADRLATYTWTSSPAGLFNGLTAAATMTIPAATLATLGAGTYTITVTVTNFVNAVSDPVSFDVEVVDKFLADVRVAGPRSASVSNIGAYTWRATAQLPACSGASGLAFNFVWSSTDATLQSYLSANSLTQGTTLIVPATQFLSLGTYTIAVKATQTTDSSNVATSSFTFTVSFGMPVMLGPSFKIAFTSAPVTMTWGIWSYRSASYSVTYRSIITCRGPGGVQCLSTSGVAMYPLTPTTSSAVLSLLSGSSASSGLYENFAGTVAVSANTFAPGAYQFTLFASYSPLSGQYSQSSGILILVAPLFSSGSRRLLAGTVVGKPVLTMTCVKGCSNIASPPIVSAGQILAFSVAAALQQGTESNTVVSTTYQWEITPTPRGGLSGVVSTDPYFTLNPYSVSNYFVQGATYNIQVTVTMTLANGNLQQGTSYQQIQVNQPPRSGSLTVPTTNSETSPITLQAPGWFDSNGGLQYQFFTRDINGVRRDLSSISSSPKYVWEYPLAGFASNSNTRIVGVAVNDALGATTLSELSVTITPQSYSSSTTTSSYISSATTTQTSKGNTEGLNQLAVQVGNGLTSGSIASGDASGLRSSLLSGTTSGSKVSSPSAFAVSVQLATGSSSQITAQTAVQACSQLTTALNTLDSTTRPSLASSTFATVVATADAILQSAVSTSSSGSRRLLATVSDSQKASVNASYALLLSNLKTISSTYLVNPGQVWESNQTTVDTLAYRFLTANALSRETKTLLVSGARQTVSVSASAGIVSSGTSADLHVIFEYPNPFTWDSVSLIGANVVVRYADASTGAALSSLAASKTTTVTIPFSGCDSSCTPTCVVWSNNQWSTTGVTAGTVTSSSIQCLVDSSIGSYVMLSVKSVSSGVTTGGSSSSSSSSSTGQGSGTTIQAVMVLNIAVGSLGGTFDTDFAAELAAAASVDASRFLVTGKEAATTTSSKISFNIYDSSSGSSAAAIYATLASAVKNGATSQYLSKAQSLTMLCSDNVQRTTCGSSDGGSSSGAGAVIGGVVGGVGFVILVVIAIICYRKSRPPKIHDSAATTTDPNATAAAQA